MAKLAAENGRDRIKSCADAKSLCFEEGVGDFIQAICPCTCAEENGKHFLLVIDLHI